ncbi:hypothetical protein LX36DRAFT_183848 [Colletotrichum falcatum]|nr:hypothetical protein LX36DRAFT_183848 [Colletotrichum falcatum]
MDPDGSRLDLLQGFAVGASVLCWAPVWCYSWEWVRPSCLLGSRAGAVDPPCAADCSHFDAALTLLARCSPS